MSKIISSLDIGNSKIICLIAQLNDENKINVKSASLYESSGIVNGNIVDINLATEAIIKTIAKAEKIFKKNIDVLSVNISGDNLKSKNLITEMNLNLNKPVIKKNIYFLSDKLKEALESEDKIPIHTIPVNFFINNIEIDNPIEITGENLKIIFHTFCANKLKIENFVNCLRKVPIKINSFVFDAYASALAVLTEEEKINNTLVIDIGSGQTSLALMSNNKFVFGYSIPLGGDTITNDLCNVLKINFMVAENIKLLNTNLFFSETENREYIKLNINNNDKELYRVSQFKKGLINDLFKERVIEIINLSLNVLKNKGIDKIKKIVITGGTANVLGLDRLITKVTGIETRIGFINNNNFVISHILNKEIILQPSYATSMGILKKIADSYEEQNAEYIKNNSVNFINKIVDFLINLFIS